MKTKNTLPDNGEGIWFIAYKDIKISMESSYSGICAADAIQGEQERLEKPPVQLLNSS